MSINITNDNECMGVCRGGSFIVFVPNCDENGAILTTELDSEASLLNFSNVVMCASSDNFVSTHLSTERKHANSIWGDHPHNHKAIVDYEGNIFTWGNNVIGQLGRPANSDKQISPDCFSSKIASVCCGAQHTVCVTRGGQVYSFGSNSHGQLGRGELGLVRTEHPHRIENLLGENITMAAAGSSHTICVSDKGCIFTWGSNGLGQLGIGDLVVVKTETPVSVFGFDIPSDIVFVCAGPQNNMVMSDKGVVWAWGDNMYGQLGIPDLHVLSRAKRVRFINHKQHMVIFSVNQDQFGCNSQIKSALSLTTYKNFELSKYISNIL